MNAVALDTRSPKALRQSLERFTHEDIELLHARMRWRKIARRKQIPPSDNKWDFYGVKSGRGFGKTLAAAKWIFESAAADPGSYNFVLAPTHEDLINTCFYGPTGLHGAYKDPVTGQSYPVIPRRLIAKSTKSPPEITLWNGAIIKGFSAETPERLRGPQCLVAETLITMADGTQVPIAAVREGDYVATRIGPRKVLAAWCSRKDAPLYRMVTVHGRSVSGTMEHLVYSEGEFVPLWQLKPGKWLHAWPDTSGAITASKLRGIMNIPAELGLEMRVDALESIYTERSMRQRWALFLQGMWYTIKTTASHVMTQLTWRRLLKHSTRSDTPKNVSTQTNAADVMLAACVPYGAALNTPTRTVFNVYRGSELNLWGSSLARSAVLAAKIGGEDQVKTVEKLATRADVYDLEVEEAHEFFAGGVLVHNCHRGWLDEVASWRDGEKAFDNFVFGLRLGDHPQVFWTGTPKPKPFIKMLVELPRSIVVSGSTYENAENLTDIFYDNIAKYEGTKIGRQEIHGEVIDPEEAGFVKRSDIRLWPAKKPLPKFRFIVLSLDTAFTEETWNKKEQEGDPTACTVWGLFEHERREHILLLDAWEDHLGFPDLIQRVKHERTLSYGDQEEPLLRPALISKGHRPAHQGRPADALLIEDKGSGISLRQMLANEDVFAHPYNPGDMDKLSRLHAVSPLFAHGRVWAVESLAHPRKLRNWADPVVTQLCTYVGEGSLKNDDLLDTATQALLFLQHKFNIRLTVRSDPYKAVAAEAERLKREGRKNPYDG